MAWLAHGAVSERAGPCNSCDMWTQLGQLDVQRRKEPGYRLPGRAMWWRWRVLSGSRAARCATGLSTRKVEQLRSP